MNDKKENNTQDPLSENLEPTVALNPLTGFHMDDFLPFARRAMVEAAFQPQVLSKHFGNYARKLVDIYSGKSTYAPDAHDQRFKDSDWKDNSLYKQLLQSYLAYNDTVEDWAADLNLSEVDRVRVDFLLRVLRDSSSPANALFTNPEALRKAWETKGESLRKGYEHLVDDLVNNHGIPAQVKKDSFEVGVNLATTPGAIVFKNELLELIQYTPSTKQVYKRPLLLVSAMINKFYAFDLTPDRSMAKFCVDSGVQTFAVSWANPTKENADWGIEKYAFAVLEAIEAIKSITGSDDLNVVSLCSGGMVVSALASYLQATGDSSIHSMTVGVCMLEMQNTDTEVAAFADDQALDRVKERSREAGVLRGHELALSMLWLRPQELIWGNIVNNYLLGNEPPEFDLLYWNNDWTNLPAQLHADVIDMFNSGCLMKPGEMTMKEVPLDLSAVECDKFFVGASSDHITPWPSCYRTSLAYGGDKEFVLSKSGHIQTFLNSPSKKRASFYTNKNQSDSPEDWFESSELKDGSWWLYWKDWLSARSGAKKVAPKKLGNKKYSPGVKAPGEYVFQKSDEQ